MTTFFNKKFGLQVDKMVMKNRHKKLRTLLLDMKTLLDLSEFGWNESCQMVIAKDEVWDDCLKVL